MRVYIAGVRSPGLFDSVLIISVSFCFDRNNINNPGQFRNMYLAERLVRRYKPAELRMKEPHNEGLASHVGPESCGAHRKVLIEALTGESAGQVLSCEIRQSRRPTLLSKAEGNILWGAICEPLETRRSRRP